MSTQIENEPIITPYRSLVYSTLKEHVGPGCFTTYQALAKKCGGSARTIGTAMKNNPFAPQVPCHRVLKSDFSIGGFMGQTNRDHQQIKRKIEMLKNEGLGYTFVWFMNE